MNGLIYLLELILLRLAYGIGIKPIFICSLRIELKRNKSDILFKESLRQFYL